MKKILSITLIVVLILTSFVSVGAEPSDYTYTKEPVCRQLFLIWGQIRHLSCMQ